MTSPELDLFGRRAQLAETHTDEDPRISLERFFRTIFPNLYTDKLEEKFSEGVQYIIMAPAPGVTEHKPPTWMPDDPDTGQVNYFTQGRFNTEGKFVRGKRIPQVGVLNVSRTLNSQEIEYCAVEERRRGFKLKLGDSLDVSGDVDALTILQVFPRLFTDGQPVFDTTKFHFADQVRGLAVYGRDGRPKPKPRTRPLPY